MTDSASRRSLLLRWAGGVLILVSVGFVAVKLHTSWSALVDWRPTGNLLVAAAAASAGYALMGFLLSSAWHLLIRCFGREKIGARTSHRLYARSQIAKYVPGNVLHLAGRHALARRAGTGHSPLAAAAVSEVAGLLTAAGGVALVGAAFVAVDRARLSLVLAAALAAAGFFAVTVAAALHPEVRRRLVPPVRSLTELSRTLVGVLALYLVFFLAGGALLLGLVVAVGADPGPGAAAAVVAAFSLSWAAGFLTPGAPAGLGVREAALVAALDGLVGEPAILLAALALRLATMVGDSLFFGASFLWEGAARTPASPGED